MTHEHGGNISQIENILDFSANINPLGVPESVKGAVRDNLGSIEKYPDPYCAELRSRLAIHEKMPAENIVCGSGADDLIFRIVHALSPRRALICAPTFSEYRKALEEVGCEIREHILTESSGFTMTDSFIEELDENYDICFVCTPNNPTGKLITADILKKLADKCRERNTILVCDECFLGFVQNGAAFSLRRCMNESSIILKAFTKLYAMAGIRLGYVVCGSSAAAERIQNSGQFWSVSALAQAAGIAALAEDDYVRRTISLIAAEREFLTAELSSLGAVICPSAANFLLFKSAAGLAEKMLSEGILIRDCSNFNGLSDGYYRIAVRTHDENVRLLDSLGRCING